MVHPRLWWAPLALTTLLWTAPTVASDDRNCYNPDGSQAADDVPCTSDDTTFCCNKKDLCMSNGLCYMQRNSGLALSRASCTDQSWDSCDDYKYCFSLNKDSGFPIVAANYDGNSTVHCCGIASYDNGTVTCKLGEVTVPVGTAIPDVAGLAETSTSSTNSTSTSNTTDTSSGSSPSSSSSSFSSSSSCSSSTSPLSSLSSNSSNDLAIGAGVGVPLGVISLASIIWALWERRGRRKALSQQLPNGPESTTQPAGYRARFVELGAPTLSEMSTEGDQKNTYSSHK